MPIRYDLAVVGGGPGGYVGAIKGAQLGLRTVCIEKDKALGGTCLNVGCIPSKTLLHISHKYYEMVNSDIFGLHSQKVRFDWRDILSKKEMVVKGLTDGIKFLFEKNHVDYVSGYAHLLDSHTLSIKENDGYELTVHADNILIATGSESKPLPGFETDEKIFLTSTGALNLPRIPSHMIIIGAGVIGLELGSVYLRMGSKVTVVEYADRICPSLDIDCGKELQRILTEQRMKFMFGKRSLKGEVDSQTNEAIVSLEQINNGEKSKLRGDACLIATGRRPFTRGLGLDKLGIVTDSLGRIVINENLQTNIPNIFAVGDVIEGPMLAHKAQEEGIAVAEFLSGRPINLNYNAIPGVIYTHPEMAFVGKTEQQLIREQMEYQSGIFPLSEIDRTKINFETSPGLVKILASKHTQQILGAHIIASSASEMIHELAMAIEYGASVEDIARTCHAHPSMSEAIKEAARLTCGQWKDR